MTVTTTSLSETMKDVYPLPGTRIKQWVVDARREAEWERETCPSVDVTEHEDNCGAVCRNSGSTQYTHLEHDCCHTCGDLHATEMLRHDIVAWIMLRDARLPIESDRTKLSDEIEPERAMGPHPLLAMLPADRR